MTKDQIKVGIATAVCQRFINLHQSTPRHGLLVDFENPDLLAEMEQHTLVQPTMSRTAYLPTVGTFALLRDDHELYQRAREAFGRTIHALWKLYRAESVNVPHEPVEFETYSNDLFPAPASEGLIPLGLYLAKEFGVLSPFKMSDDQTTVESFQVSEQVIRMRDATSWWNQRVQSARVPSSDFAVPTEILRAVRGEDDDEVEYGEAIPTMFYDESFWSLIHPAVEAEARPRYEAGHPADAVEWGLKVVATEVRRRTGLTIDGSDLMHQAFSPRKPYLVFEDPIPSTQISMQQGYMEVFAGAMTGIRNPKAHGMIQLDRRRFIHFIFLASLLAEKLGEAVDAPSLTKGETP